MLNSERKKIGNKETKLEIWKKEIGNLKENQKIGKKFGNLEKNCKFGKNVEIWK